MSNYLLILTKDFLNSVLQTKVQIHFSNFLINLTNDVIHTEFNCKDMSFN